MKILDNGENLLKFDKNFLLMVNLFDYKLCRYFSIDGMFI